MDENTQEADQEFQDPVAEAEDTDDLVYREYYGYQGTEMLAGTAYILTDEIQDIMDKAEEIVIYQNGRIYDRYPYDGTVRETELEDKGIYCFLVTDDAGNQTDITEYIQVLSWIQDGAVIYLN